MANKVLKVDFPKKDAGVTSIPSSVVNQVTPATAQRMGDGRVIPIQRPKKPGGKK